MKQLKRFEQIILQNQNEDVLAFLGLGSMHETSRLDEYSDIDFFMIVEKGYKNKYLNHIKWLEVAPVIFWYQETKDGLKVIYEDGIMLEFAIFEVDELSTIPYQVGTIYYKKPSFNETLLTPQIPLPKKHDVSWTLSTLLSNLYVGLLREHRGERVAAFLMIQVYATHHLLMLLDPHQSDPFVVERRIETRIDIDFQTIYPGIQHNLLAAKSILKLACEHHVCPEKLVSKLTHLINN